MKDKSKQILAGQLQGQFVSVPEAAALLRISPVSIRRYLGQGKLKRYKVGARTLLKTSDVLGLVEAAE